MVNKWSAFKTGANLNSKIVRETDSHTISHVQNSGDSYLLLEDLTRGFQRPNVIDLKIGTQTFDPLASEIKRKKEIAKYCNMQDLGFCVTDYRQYDAESMTFRLVEYICIM